MKLAALTVSILFALALWPQSASTHAQQKPEELAQKSAEAWLALSDSGKYGKAGTRPPAPSKAPSPVINGSVS